MIRYLHLIFTLILLAGCTNAPVTCETDDCKEQDVMTEIVNAWSSPGKIKPGSQGQALLLQAHFPEAGNYTVQFSVQDPNNLGIGNRVLLRAEITWVVRGNFVRRVVDVASGVSVTGTGEGVNVRVFDASTVLVPATAKEISISAQIVKGTRPAVNQPPRYWLQDIALGAGADSEVVIIPDDIGAISVFTAIRPNAVGTAIGAYDIVEYQCASQAGAVVLNSYEPRQTDWVPLAGGTRSLLLETSAAAPLLVATIILGIDG